VPGRSSCGQASYLATAERLIRWPPSLPAGNPCTGGDRPAHDSPQIGHAPAGFLDSANGHLAKRHGGNVARPWQAPTVATMENITPTGTPARRALAALDNPPPDVPTGPQKRISAKARRAIDAMVTIASRSKKSPKKLGLPVNPFPAPGAPEPRAAFAREGVAPPCHRRCPRWRRSPARKRPRGYGINLCGGRSGASAAPSAVTPQPGPLYQHRAPRFSALHRATATAAPSPRTAAGNRNQGRDHHQRRDARGTADRAACHHRSHDAPAPSHDDTRLARAGRDYQQHRLVCATVRTDECCGDGLGRRVETAIRCSFFANSNPGPDHRAFYAVLPQCAGRRARVASGLLLPEIRRRAAERRWRRAYRSVAGKAVVTERA
jgi:hypothetical protein